MLRARSAANASVTVSSCCARFSSGNNSAARLAHAAKLRSSRARAVLPWRSVRPAACACRCHPARRQGSPSATSSSATRCTACRVSWLDRATAETVWSPSLIRNNTRQRAELCPKWLVIASPCFNNLTWAALRLRENRRNRRVLSVSICQLLTICCQLLRLA